MVQIALHARRENSNPTVARRPMELRQTVRTVLKILGRPLPLLTAGAMSVMEDRTKMDLLSSASFVRQVATSLRLGRPHVVHAR